ncbi:MAG: glycine--tRNA ligase subunit beta, partial [Nanoarchaeota archaeon]|nr:glycine--tRNA ligase subunit beta [Nanoarchaeota archaeon]
MLKDTNFLCEIGTEEIPAGYLPPAIDSIKKFLKENLEKSRIDFSDFDVYATPRRIAIFISDLAHSQKEEEIELKGPSEKVAFDSNGNPTKALQGFLNGNNINLDNIYKEATEKGNYIFAKKKLESRNTEEIIPEIIEKIIKNIPFPKQMRWSDKSILFSRPISYFLVLFNDKQVNFQLDGISSSNKTRGHYIQHDEMLKIDKISEYENVLKKNGVIIDHNARKEFIRKELHAAAEKVGGVLNDDEALLDIVTFLVENPVIVTCEFDIKFLEIPDIVLIAEMREHQKYFSVLDNDGKLTKYFLVTSNNPETEYVKVGNVRVITARFNDAEFFYNEDK